MDFLTDPKNPFCLFGQMLGRYRYHVRKWGIQHDIKVTKHIWLLFSASKTVVWICSQKLEHDTLLRLWDGSDYSFLQSLSELLQPLATHPKRVWTCKKMPNTSNFVNFSIEALYTIYNLFHLLNSLVAHAKALNPKHIMYWTTLILCNVLYISNFEY